MICARVIGPYGSCPTTGGCAVSEPEAVRLGVESGDVVVGAAERLGLADRDDEGRADGDCCRVTVAVGVPGFVITTHGPDAGVEEVAVGLADAEAVALAVAVAVADVGV